jgi:hypothetical protein
MNYGSLQLKGKNHINETVDIWFTPPRKITETVFQDHSVKKKNYGLRVYLYFMGMKEDLLNTLWVKF